MSHLNDHATFGRALYDATIGAFAASLMQQRMFNDRIEKRRAVVESTIGIAESLENRVVSHQFTHEQALALLRDDVHAIRFDGGGGYGDRSTVGQAILESVPPRVAASERVRHPTG